jgi:hypothetical protein
MVRAVRRDDDEGREGRITRGGRIAKWGGK